MLSIECPAHNGSFRVNLFRVEPGVLTLYAVSLKEHPEQIRLFEIYKDMVAYESHLQSPHFKTHKRRTQQMVKALRLIETEPILLSSKSR
ncbi:MAG: putative quinol monooxygenase [Acidobacteriota bacterium]